MKSEPPIQDAEVVREIPAALKPAAAADSGAPIHPAAAILLIVVDNLWNFADWAVIAWIVTIPLSFLSVFIPTFFLQKALRKDSPGRALGYALLLGVVAAVPTSVTGTPVGLALLAWTGLARLIGRPLAR